MELARARREHLGPLASAALPALWRLLDRKGWSHSDFGRELGMSSANAARVLYGDRKVGRRIGAVLDELGIKLSLWELPCPADWTPHGNARVRRARARAARTGTDD